MISGQFQVGDRLFSAFGQDTIDALFWTATEPRGRKREHIGVLAHLLLTIIYVILHTVLVLLQATTLNVAINASNKALLTIMMSNNVSTKIVGFFQNPLAKSLISRSFSFFFFSPFFSSNGKKKRLSTVFTEAICYFFRLCGYNINGPIKHVFAAIFG